MKLFSKPFVLTLISALIVSMLALTFTTGTAAVEIGENLVVNPSFEEGDNAAPPLGWDIVGFNATIDNSDSHTGNSLLSVWNPEGPDVIVSQTITDLPEGRYELKSYSKGWGQPIDEVYMFVKDHGGDEIRLTEVNLTGEFDENVITNINVTSGQATIGFVLRVSTATGMSWDDFSFVLLGDIQEDPSEEPSEAESEEPSEAESEEPSEAESEEPSEAESEEPSKAESEEESKDETPKTGDNSLMMYGLLVLAVAAAAIFVTIPKKANN